MDKPKRFLECLLPTTICNLECPYCYIIQEHRRKMEKVELKYSPEHIAKALQTERLGGKCWISICGAGETLIQDEAIDIVQLLLKEGHYVNITTNGTLDKQFDKLIERCNGNLNHLHIAFSWHFTELKKRNLTDRFFSNIVKIKNAGASILLQINLCDEYLPYIDEIKRISMEKLGAYPQVALTRDESCNPMKIYSSLSDEEYYKIGKTFDSPLFDFTFKNFNVKRNEYCYAGEWSGVLNLQTGWLSKCYANCEGQNIFENINEPIKFSAVGRYCQNCYCINSSHFMSLGVIPEIETPTYAQLRNRPEAHWYTPEMETFLNFKLNESNKEHSKVYMELKECYRNIRRKFNI